MPGRIPVTVLTGYLGAGKTTLLNRILSDAIVVETTGLADPGPVAQTFFVDPFLQGDLQREWRPGETRSSRLVFIGRRLDRGALEAGFASCAAHADE